MRHRDTMLTYSGSEFGNRNVVRVIHDYHLMILRLVFWLGVTANRMLDRRAFLCSRPGREVLLIVHQAREIIEQLGCRHTIGNPMVKCQTQDAGSADH